MAGHHNGIKLRHLVTFLEVARLRGFGRAAEHLHVTQPAVSKAVRELEDLLGAPLLDRAAGAPRLTALGVAFQRHAAAAVAALDQGIGAARAARGGEAVTVAVGALPTVSARVLPDAIRRFGALGLGARARVVTGPNSFLLSQLRHGEVDLVVGRMGAPEQMAGLAFEHLYSEPVVMAVRAAHPLLAEPGAFPRGLSRFTMLLPPPDSIIRPSVDRLLLWLGAPAPAAVVETVSTAFGRTMVATGDAVWLISEGVVARDVEEGTLALLPVDTGDTSGPVGLTTRAGEPLAVPAAALAAAVRDAAARRGRGA